MKIIKKDILGEQIFQQMGEELERAKSKFKAFNSTHESYSIIKEEVDELQDEVKFINSSLDRFWSYVKSNNLDGCSSEILHIYKFAMNTAKEAIQVGAMARRFMEDIIAGGKNNEQEKS